MQKKIEMLFPNKSKIQPKPSANKKIQDTNVNDHHGAPGIGSGTP